ncbi:serine/threonine-protein kinase [Nonomuraea endophytica]|uniref:WD40 repeat protein n=1 Tax=Nonomuraea endophytica TaxID=714136 RepID=A0A7W8A7M9_9ACTN|nr:WD40 repeat domain-containing serine/threonine protein kinase [Nonomuraea endophytica]MBB5080240.1 WD40 repeat protein [Nonomuraea endophytica]
MAALTPSDPHRLGGYWLAGRLGAGGQGVVYDAYGPDGERVAIKVPRADSPESRRRLGKEADAARRVAAFCTARVVEVDLGVPYVVSEFVPGRTLREVVAEVGPYAGEGLHRLAVGVATALAAIHRAGVVHRDLKPDNIILGPDGPRVIDFGVAREAGPTTTGPVMGTPNYMAPELFSGRGAGAAADLWSWGLVVLFAARGADAVEPGDPVAVVSEVLGYRADVEGLPEPLGPLVAAALAQEPGRRPGARAVLLALLGLPDGDDAGEGDAALARGGALAATLAGPAAEPGLGAAAEELYGELSERERAAAPEVFLRMADGESVREVTRAELPEEEAVDGLLALFTASGLVSAPGADTYALARPGLVQAWPRLRDWVADNREGLPVQRRLAEAALFWDGHGRKPADLLHGSHLDRTLRWAAAERKDLTLVRLEREFLDAATARSRRRVRLRAMLAGAMAVLLVLALGGLALAEYRRTEVAAQRDAATARALALRAAGLRVNDPKLAMLLSVAAYRLDPGIPETRVALIDSRSQRFTDTFTDPDAAPDVVYATSRDGRLLVAVQSGQARLWDVRAHRQLRQFTGVGAAGKAAITADGKILALQDDRAVRLWDVASGRPIGAAFATGLDATDPGELAFDAGGRLLAVPDAEGGRRWWTVKDRKALRADLYAVDDQGDRGVVTPRRGKVELWDLRANRRIGLPGLPRAEDVESVEISGDGRWLAYAQELSKGAERRLEVRDLKSGGTRRSVIPDGVARTLTFGFGDELIAHWDLLGDTVVQRRSDGQQILRMEMSSDLESVRPDPGDRAIRLVMNGGVIHTVGLAALLDKPVVSGDSLGTGEFAPGGRLLATFARGEVRLWDVARGRPVGVPIAWGDPMLQGKLAFDPTGRRLAVGTDDGVLLIDTGTGTKLTSFRPANPKASSIYGLEFSPDDRTLAIATGGIDGALPLELRDLRSGSSRAADVESEGVTAWRPDGRVLMTATALIDPVKGARLARPRMLGTSLQVYDFSPDGRYLAVWMAGRLVLWDARLTARIDDLPVPPGFEATRLAWSRDGTMLAAYGFGDQIRLWDIGSRQALGTVFDGMTEYGFMEGAAIAFAEDGRTLLSATPEGVLRTHPLDPVRLAKSACQAAGRALTSQEWSHYLPEAEPFPVCPDAG